MQTQPHHNPRSWIRKLLAATLVLCCLIFGWVIFQAFDAYSIVASADIRDSELRLMTQHQMEIAKTWTSIVAVCSFFAGISVVTIYVALKRKHALTTCEAADFESVDSRTF